MTNRPRPFGVTLLAILAGVAGLAAAYHTMQYLHILPMSLGPLSFYGFDLLGALIWAALTVMYAWVVSMLWTVNPVGWLWVVLVSGANLVLGGLAVLGSSSFSAEAPALLINAVVLLYCLVPSTRSAFGTS